MCCATAEEAPEQEAEEKPAESFGAEGKEETGVFAVCGNGSFVLFSSNDGLGLVCGEKVGDGEGWELSGVSQGCAGAEGDAKTASATPCAGHCGKAAAPMGAAPVGEGIPCPLSGSGGAGTDGLWLQVPVLTRCTCSVKSLTGSQ